jgi:hypothetical protein
MKKLTTKQKHRNQRLAKSRHQNKLDRKGLGVEYGTMVKMHNKLAKLYASSKGNLVTGVGTGVSEINSPELENTTFVE